MKLPFSYLLSFLFCFLVSSWNPAFAVRDNFPPLSSLSGGSFPAIPAADQFEDVETIEPHLPSRLPSTAGFMLENVLSDVQSEDVKQGEKRNKKKELVGYWSFDDFESSTVFDQSGFNNHGMLTGAALGEGKFGQGLALTGTGGLTVADSPSLNSLPGGFTLSAWIKSTSYPDFTTIFWKTDRHNRIHQLHFQVDGRLHAAMNQIEPEGGFQGFSPFVVPLNEWHYVAWTYDEKAHRFYDNGEKVFEAAFSDPWAGNTVDLLIGFHPEISSANFHGFIDEARIYRGALTAGQIRRDMKNRGPSAHLSPFIAASFEGVAAPKSSKLLGTHYRWDAYLDCEDEASDSLFCR